LVDFLYCEFLKLKRSKILLISILGSLVAPGFSALSIFEKLLREPTIAISIGDMYLQTQYMFMVVFGTAIYGVIAAYLFNREYADHTLKTILTIPVNRTKFLVCKFVMLTVWLVLMAVLAWAAVLIIGVPAGVTGYSVAALWQWLQIFVFGAILYSMVLTPIIFITLWLKNMLTIMIIIVVLSTTNLIMTNSKYACYNPFMLPRLISLDGFAVESPGIVSVVLITVFMLGAAASIIYFQRQDVR